ncbi:MAG TPA: hypothetical protein DDW76_14800 [Cyanobacteria bacterium UBA11369]|nr:hypothetical protein [Cyanobacteria bacterium UBA11371]HBE16321.1 hypothetical protein [Cyanobacteria bacterium UBA11367]HBE36094.1 hypothetical protein [Cyanobacteria bacterium UBA11368]HBE50026.1 hypothetical protein [Cyanobacteria bacterium UBA11369]
MQPNQQHDIEAINVLLQQIEQSRNLREFETIKLPFELVQAGMSLWESTFHPEVFRQLAGADPETLEAWAIALSQTLNIQLEILNFWLPHLTTLPIPTTLKQKISDRVASINQIANDKSKLIQSAANLLEQEEKLQQSNSELQSLKEKVRQLQEIQTELEATNLDNLQEFITTQTAALEPQQKKLRSLQQQKADLDDHIAALERQQAILKQEIYYWQSRQNRIETSTENTVAELIILTQLQRERLSETLAGELAALQQQRNELTQQQESYHQAQQQLQKAREDFQKYQTATEEAIAALNTHYQSDRALGSLLPIDRNKVDNLFRNAQQTLAEIDQELAAARSKHEQAQQKTRFTF